MLVAMAKKVIKLNEERLKQIISESIWKTFKKNRDIDRLVKKIEDKVNNSQTKTRFDFDSNNCTYVSPDSGYKVAIFSNGNVYCGPYCEPAEKGNVTKTELFNLLFDMDVFYKVSNEDLAGKIAKWCTRYLKDGVSSRERACEIDTWLL